MGDIHSAGTVQNSLAYCDLAAGDFVAARARFSFSLEECERRHDDIHACYMLLNLGSTAVLAGDLDDAYDQNREAIERGRRLRVPFLVGAGLDGMALVASGAYDHRRAAMLHGAGDCICERVEHRA